MDKLTLRRIKGTKQLTFLLLAIIAFVFVIFVYQDKTKNVLDGFITILTSQAVLITDYLVIGGIGATFLNALIILLFNYTLIKAFKQKINGLVVAAFFTVFGFSFFGKNIFNILPFYLGGLMYSRYEHINFKEILPTIMFTSALAPFISEIAFNKDMAVDTSYLSAIALGITIGFFVTPIAKKMATFHEGFNLYNLGFTGGIIGAVVASLMIAYDYDITPQKIISKKYDSELIVICSMIFLLMIIVGFYINNNSFKDYSKIIQDSGLKSDFITKYGYGITMINMGIMGFVALGYVKLLGQSLNGPLIAGILTVVGFSAFGKHFLNTIPVLVGVWIASLGSAQVDNFVIALSGLFGTALAPITGVYGPLWGIFAGWLHLGVVKNIGIVHGGLNLYNNGFSAGIVAGFLLPIIRTFTEHKSKIKNKYFLKRKELMNNYYKEDNK